MDGCCGSPFPLERCVFFLHSSFIFVLSFVSYCFPPCAMFFFFLPSIFYSFIHVHIWFWLHHLFFLSTSSSLLQLKMSPQYPPVSFFVLLSVWLCVYLYFWHTVIFVTVGTALVHVYTVRHKHQMASE